MDSPNASLSDIGALIAQDLGITAKILQTVNSAYFGIARRISNPMEAVQLLGLQRVRSLALSAHVFSSFDQVRMKNFPLAKVWKHCIAASRMAQEICRAEKADRAMAEDAQLACMLHDVGKVMLASGDPNRYQAAVALAIQRQAPLVEVEREVFGVSHADVGAYLLGLWGLPWSLVEAVGMHHSPDAWGTATTNIPAKVAFAEQLVSAVRTPDGLVAASAAMLESDLYLILGDVPARN